MILASSLRRKLDFDNVRWSTTRRTAISTGFKPSLVTNNFQIHSAWLVPVLRKSWKKRSVRVKEETCDLPAWFVTAANHYSIEVDLLG